MAYASWSVVYGEQPSAAKWNILGTNDAGFNDGSAIANLTFGTITSVALSYKFRAYRTAALNSSNSYTRVAYDTVSFDTGSNVDIVTNQGRFTAPIAGFYLFNAAAANTSAGSTSMYSALYKNGSRMSLGSGNSAATTGQGTTVSDFVQLSAGDYVEHFFIGGSGSAMTVGADGARFSGYLVCKT